MHVAYFFEKADLVIKRSHCKISIQLLRVAILNGVTGSRIGMINTSCRVECKLPGLPLIIKAIFCIYIDPIRQREFI